MLCSVSPHGAAQLRIITTSHRNHQVSEEARKEGRPLLRPGPRWVRGGCARRCALFHEPRFDAAASIDFAHKETRGRSE